MSFTPTTWINGAAPGISAEQLNRIEQGIEDLDLATISIPVTTTAAVISLPSTTLEGRLSAVVGGNTKTALQDDTWATSLTGWTSADDSIDAATYYKLIKATSTTSERDISTILTVTKNWLVTAYGINASDTAGAKFDVINGSGGASIVASATLTATQLSRIGLILQASDLTGKTPYLRMSHIGNGSVKFYQFFIQEISSAEYAEGLTVLMARYYYRTMGTKSTFKDGGRVKATGKNLFNRNNALAKPAYSIVNYLDKDCLSWIAGSLVSNGLGTFMKNNFKLNTRYVVIFDMAVTSGNATFAILYTDGSITSFSQVSTITSFSRRQLTSDVNKTIDGITGVYNSDQRVYIDLSTFQIEEGTTATPYEPYTDTAACIPPSTNGLTSVGTIKDEIDINTGVKTQRNSGDASIATTVYNSLDKTTYTNVDVVKTTAFALAKAGTAVVDGFTTYLNSAGTVLTEIAAADIDLAASAGKYYYHTDKTVWIFITPDIYADITAARTGLGTTTLDYQLAVPIMTEIEGMGQLMAEPSGSIIIEPAIKFEAKPVVGVITIPTGWVNILTVESVKQITMNTDGSLTYGSSITPASNTTTTLTLTTYDDTKFYEVVYLYDAALSTIPDTTYSYPTNIRGEIDSIGDMASQTAENLDELNDFTITQLIALNSVWKNWTPTLTWTTATPASVTTVARYITIGNTCFFNFMCTSADGNAATQLSISLPVAAKDNNSFISFTAQELVDTTWSNPLAYLDDDSGGITFRIFSVATDTKTVTVVVTGQYEVSVA